MWLAAHRLVEFVQAAFVQVVAVERQFAFAVGGLERQAATRCLVHHPHAVQRTVGAVDFQSGARVGGGEALVGGGDQATGKAPERQRVVFHALRHAGVADHGGDFGRVLAQYKSQ